LHELLQIYLKAERITHGDIAHVVDVFVRDMADPTLYLVVTDEDWIDCAVSVQLKGWLVELDRLSPNLTHVSVSAVDKSRSDYQRITTRFHLDESIVQIRIPFGFFRDQLTHRMISEHLEWFSQGIVEICSLVRCQSLALDEGVEPEEFLDLLKAGANPGLRDGAVTSDILRDDLIDRLSLGRIDAHPGSWKGR
jgi:hypothetical protein